MHHQLDLEVRHYECDVYNHVNNAVYLNYLEFARERTLRDHGLDYQAWIAAGHGIVVQEYHLTYRSPAVAGEHLVITTRPVELGGASVVLAQSISGPQGRPVVEATVKLVWVGPTGRPTRIPPDWKAAFTPA